MNILHKCCFFAGIFALGCSSITDITVKKELVSKPKLDLHTNAISLHEIQYTIKVKDKEPFFILDQDNFNKMMLNNSMIYHSLVEHQQIIKSYKQYY